MSLEILSSCPVCSGQVFESYLEVEDHSVSHGTFKIVRCKKCNFLFTNPRPAQEKIASYYDSENYISHHDEGDSVLSEVYNMVRKLAVRSKLNLLKKNDTEVEKEILDIGCGTGFFLSSCKEQNWTITGTEPDHDARLAARKNTGSPIYESIFDPEFHDRQFSSITMWHVLEHVHQLQETMTWIHHHLKPKGTLFIAVPNPQSYDAKLFGPYWAAYDVPRHLYHFTKETMEKLLQQFNFSIVDLKCMLFDSYYVSLLSNQYKYGKSKILNSILSGTLSNIKGFGTNLHNTNSSSIIYIAHKK